MFVRPLTLTLAMIVVSSSCKRNEVTEPWAMAPAQARPPVTAEAVPPGEGARVAAFTVHLLSRLPGDVVLSPWAVRTSLGLAALGARGTTLEELKVAAQLDADPETSARQLGLTTRALQQLPSLSGHAVSGVFVSSTTSLMPAWVALARSGGATEVQRVDFSTNGLETINRWAANQTSERITEALPAGSVSRDTKLVVTSAMALDAVWQIPFPSDQTRRRPFRRPGQSDLQVPMMFSRNAPRPQKHTGAYAVAVLTCTDAHTELVLVVPNADDGLPALEATLLANGLDPVFEGLKTSRLDLYLPAFEQTASLRLRPALQAMGVHAAFQGDADFSGLNGDRSLLLADVFHAVKVEVNESGVRGAAVSAGDFEWKSMNGPGFIAADRPFLYFVREVPSGVILFAGRVVNPAGQHDRVPAAGPPAQVAPPDLSGY
jgi:serpin B